MYFNAGLRRGPAILRLLLKIAKAGKLKGLSKTG